MTDQPYIKTSPKFGLNPSTLCCRECGGEGRVVFGRIIELHNPDQEAPKKVEGVCLNCQISSFFEEIKRRVL